MPAILNFIMFLQLSCGLRYCTEFGTSMANYAPMTDDMTPSYYKQIQHGSRLAATILHSVFMIIQSHFKHFYIVVDSRYPKMIHMLKLIFYSARRWMDTALNLVLQQNWQRIIFSSNFQYKTANIKFKN